MRTPKEIRADIRTHKAEMKAQNIPITSFMNRLEPHISRANARLYALKLELKKAEEADNYDYTRDPINQPENMR